MMNYGSDRLFTHHDALHPSPSLARQRWSQLNLAHSHPVIQTVTPPQHANSYRFGSTLDDTTRAYRTTSLRHLSGSNQPSSSNRPESQTGGRPSTEPSQPVLVRAYSGGPNGSMQNSRMSLRRSFPFIGRSETPNRGPGLPSDDDFSIDGILRAIEPNIRQTLDSIGEICGRSKLSLANEYGSHIAPLGEIRAQPGGLMPVDEASSEHERQAGDNVVIYDDDRSAIDAQDRPSFMRHGYSENSSRQGVSPRNAASLPFTGGDESSVQAQPDTPLSTGFQAVSDTVSTLAVLPTAREFSSRPKPSGRALLGKNVEPSTDDASQTISTPALVSEVLLDAQAASGAHVSDDGRKHWLPTAAPAVLMDMFGWIKQAVYEESDTGRDKQTAEMRLRTMLEQSY
ncbi:hypothetical protein BDV25DRAFT_166475 [Aspergillus avenaceus]|uniref:Uncharacterized protein n=1 Tax=Aspergillus avenaceus TaxID=36643 RepID=A0A5N6TEB5_ASPAV|nr:hypothetical protein BDV25DRAFT_166475 [Aspergillus avenaceus]